MVDWHTITGHGMCAAELPFVGSRCSTLCPPAHDSQRTMGRLFNNLVRLFMRQCLRSNQSVQSGWPPQPCRGGPSPKLSTRRTTIAATGPMALPAGHCQMLEASKSVPGHGTHPLCLSVDGVAASEIHCSEGPLPRGAETSTTTMESVLRCFGSRTSVSCCRSMSGESGRELTGGMVLTGPNHRTK